ncbi:hypothetical protein V6B68_03630 [Mesomycoplasma ovipneumoniae str. Black Butte]|uniref:hypothetical protein n=1 Tax=Mesomycoplasma ovipneumoniae TaxID=29562 RepID=UPI002FDA90D5
MPSIIEIEVKNLSTEEKEVFYKHLKVYGPKKFDPNNLDKLLESYFWNFPADFIAFQKGYKYSIYNQTIQKNNFKDLDYKYIVESLTQDQKNRITEYIRLNAKHIKDKDGNDYHDEPYIVENTDQYREEFEKNYDFNEETRKWWDKNKNSKYILLLPLGEESGDVEFFEDDDELILSALKDKVLAPRLLKRYLKILDPHLRVNHWIEKNYELEQVQKDNSDQVQKFEEPEKKL